MGGNLVCCKRERCARMRQEGSSNLASRPCMHLHPRASPNFSSCLLPEQFSKLGHFSKFASFVFSQCLSSRMDQQPGKLSGLHAKTRPVTPRPASASASPSSSLHFVVSFHFFILSPSLSRLPDLLLWFTSTSSAASYFHPLRWEISYHGLSRRHQVSDGGCHECHHYNAAQRSKKDMLWGAHDDCATGSQASYFEPRCGKKGDHTRPKARAKAWTHLRIASSHSGFLRVHASR